MEIFKKQTANENFNHQENVINKFFKMGYSNVRVTTSLLNGVSNYVTFEVKVLNKNKLFMDMDFFGDYTEIKVRISDHRSNLDRFGSSKNTMTMSCLEILRESGAIDLIN